MQIIADKTRIYIQNEEDDAIEATGMPYDFDKLVWLASKYERQHNKLPGENIQTVFEASVTIPKNRKKQEDFIKQIVHEVLVNPVMARDQSPKQQRDDSRNRLDALRSEQCRDKFNKKGLFRKKFFLPHKTCHNPRRNLQPLSHNPLPQKPIPSKNQQRIEQLFFTQLVDLPQLIDRRFRSQTEVEKERNVEREKIASLINNLDLLALTNQTIEMNEVKIFRKAPRNLMLPRVKDLTTVEKEKNAWKKIAFHTDSIMIAAQIGLNCKIDTSTQGIPLLATHATLLATPPLTIQITPPPPNVSTPKSIIVIAMIEMFLTNGTCKTIPHTTITVEIAHRHLMLTRNAEMHLTIDSITLFLKKLPKKFWLEFLLKMFRWKTTKTPKGSHTC